MFIENVKNHMPLFGDDLLIINSIFNVENLTKYLIDFFHFNQ